MSTRLTPAQRTLRSRIAAHAMHAQHDSRETTKAARAGLEQKFVDQVDPDRQLPEAERLKRVKHAKKVYYTRLALKSSKARSAKATANNTQALT